MPLPSGLPFHALAPNKISLKGDIPSLAASRHQVLGLAGRRRAPPKPQTAAVFQHP